MKWIIAMLLCLCLVGIVHAEDNTTTISSTEYSFIELPACYGTVDVLVTQRGNNIVDYGIRNCNYNQGASWSCPCMPNLTLVIPYNTTTTFDVKVQYYTAKPIDIPANQTTVNGMPSSDELYNANLKRIINVNNIAFLNNQSIQTGSTEEEQGDITDFVFFIFGSIIVIGLVIVVIILLIYIFSDKLRKVFGLDKEKEAKPSWFSRLRKGERTRLERGKEPKVPKAEKVPLPPSNNAQDEIKKILEGLDK